MSISFICTCGKHLRARDEMAARRTMCPACGRPVGIPTSKPTQRGAPAGPLSPEQRRRHSRPVLVTEEPTVIVPVLNNPLQPHSAAGQPRSPAALHYRAVEIPCDDAQPKQAEIPVALPAPRPVEMPCGYRVIELDCETENEDRERRLQDARTIELRARRHLRSRRRRRELPWPLEQHWYECLLFPFLTWKWLLGFAVILSLLSASAVSWGADVPVQTSDFFFDPQSDLLVRWAFRGLFVLVTFAFTCSFFQWVLSSAAAASVPHGYWPISDVRLLVRGTSRWLVCLVAGPILLVALGFYFWMECGELTVWDWLILAELGILAVGCWLFALVAVTRSGRLVDANPIKAVEEAQRLGSRGVAVVVGTFLALSAVGWLTLNAIEMWHTPGRGLAGWMLLTFCLFCGMFTFTFLLRLLGMWSRQAVVRPAS
jgi:hypothetical protein